MSTKRITDLPLPSLPPEEQARHDYLCGIVDNQLSGFIAMADALAEIQESRSYRYEANSFSSFCFQRFKVSRAHAYRLITAGTIKKSPVGDQITNEGQARALAQVPEADREQILEMASAAGPVTAASIESAHATIVENASQTLPDRTSKPILAPEIDSEGFEIPEGSLPYWHRRSHIKELMQTVSDVKRDVKAAFEGKEWVGTLSNYQSCMTALSNAHNCLKFCMPYTVCTSCNGVRPQKCTHCRGAGMLSEQMWKITPPEELKAFRAKNLKAKVV